MGASLRRNIVVVSQSVSDPCQGKRERRLPGMNGYRQSEIHGVQSCMPVSRSVTAWSKCHLPDTMLSVRRWVRSVTSLPVISCVAGVAWAQFIISYHLFSISQASKIVTGVG